MPYICQSEKDELFNLVVDLRTAIVEGRCFTAGHLNYLFTIMAHSFVERRGMSYGTLNDVVGVFESAKAEFQRRIVNPYEDLKIKENGDV